MSERLTLPVLPLREVVLFPGVSMPVGAGRPPTLRAIEAALKSESRLILAVAQRENVDDVTPGVLYPMGTIAKISQIQRGLGGVQLLLHGETRGTAVHFVETGGHLEAVVREVADMMPLKSDDPAFLALYREARDRAAELGQKSGLPEEVVRQVLDGVTDPGRLADLVAGYLDIKPAERQALLETLSVEERLRRVLVHVQRQIAVLDAQEHIKSQVQEELGERQREMLLREQMKAIRKELGEEDEGGEEGSGERAAAARAGEPGLHGSAGDPHLSRDDGGATVEQARRGGAGPEARRRNPRGGSLRPQGCQGPGPRIPRRAPAPPAAARARVQGSGIRGGYAAARQRRRQTEGSHPAVRRPAGRGQDLNREVHRPGHGAAVRPHFARWRSGRGRHPGPPAYLCGRHAWPHHSGDEAGRRQEPGLPARRGGQARRVVPGRSGGGAARGAGPGAERLVHGPLPRGAVRPVGGAVHRHGELPAVHPRAARGQDGPGELRRLHGARKARDRKALSGSAAAATERLDGRAAPAHGRGAERDDRELHPRGGRPPAGARDREARPKSRAQDRSEERRVGKECRSRW